MSPAVYTWGASDEEPVAVLIIRRPPSREDRFLCRPPGGWWCIPDEEPGGLVPSPLEDLLACENADDLDAWATRWADPDALSSARFAQVPVAWSDTWRRFDPKWASKSPLLKDMESMDEGFTRDRILSMVKDSDAALAGRPPRPIVRASFAFLPEVQWYASEVLARIDVPASMENETLKSFSGHVVEGVSLRTFYAQPAPARLQLKGMLPPTWDHALESRIRWNLAIPGAASPIALGMASSTDRSGTKKSRKTKGIPIQLAEGAALTWTAETDALAAIVWLEFFWAVQHRMQVRTCPCHGCGRPYLSAPSPDLPRGYCAHHTPPPWADADAAHAFEASRRRYTKRATETPSWSEWLRTYRPRRT